MNVSGLYRQKKYSFEDAMMTVNSFDKHEVYMINEDLGRMR